MLIKSSLILNKFGFSLNLKNGIQTIWRGDILAEEMIKIDPLNEKIIEFIAICYHSLKNFEQAILP